MRYMVIINDEEIRGNGEEPTFQENWEAVSELLRSGYYEVDLFIEEPDDEDDDD